MPRESPTQDRPAWEVGVVLGAIPARMLADLLGGATVPGLGASAMHVLAAVVVAALLAVVFRHGTALARHPLRWPLGVLGALLCVGFVRAPDATTGLWEGARVGSGLLLLVAASVVPVGPRPMLAAALGAGALATATSLGALVLGQMDRRVHDGIPRLVGAYGDVHTHGLVMALVAGGALALAAAPGRRGPRLAAGALCVAAAVCATLSWVRTAAVLLALVAGGTLVLAGRWRVVVAAVALAAVGVALHPTARDRAADLVALVTLSEPAEGWASIGRFRPAIWRNATTAFLDLPPSTWLLGNGLGGHLTFWKPTDPHDEYLALWFQMGVLAPFAWLAAALLGVRHALARRAEASGPDRVLYGWIASLAVAAVLVAVISNTFVARVTLSWWLWGFVGAALPGSWRSPRAPG